MFADPSSLRGNVLGVCVVDVARYWSGMFQERVQLIGGHPCAPTHRSRFRGQPAFFHILGSLHRFKSQVPQPPWMEHPFECRRSPAVLVTELLALRTSRLMIEQVCIPQLLGRPSNAEHL